MYAATVFIHFIQLQNWIILDNLVLNAFVSCKTLTKWSFESRNMDTDMDKGSDTNHSKTSIKFAYEAINKIHFTMVKLHSLHIARNLVPSTHHFWCDGLVCIQSSTDSDWAQNAVGIFMCPLSSSCYSDPMPDQRKDWEALHTAERKKAAQIKRPKIDHTENNVSLALTSIDGTYSNCTHHVLCVACVYSVLSDHTEW